MPSNLPTETRCKAGDLKAKSEVLIRRSERLKARSNVLLFQAKRLLRQSVLNGYAANRHR